MSSFYNLIKKEYLNSKIKINISNSYKSLLNNLFNNIKNKYINVEPIYQYNISNLTPIVREIRDYTNKQSKFISPQIKNTINKYIYTHRCIIENNTIYYFSKNKSLTNSEKNNIKKALLRIKVLKNYFNNEMEVNIGIYPTHFKKTINKIRKKLIPLGANNVNSGLTFYTLGEKKNGTIILWRLEEMNKVIIHELFHSIKVDIGLILNEDIFEPYMKKKYNLDKFIGINESYIETLACIFNVILYVIENKLSKNEFIVRIKYEIFYSITKASQILNYYGLSNLNDLIQEKHIKFIQNSNIFSYYILKLFILYNFNKVIIILFNQKCLNNNLIIEESEKCSQNYLNIISNIYNKSLDNMISYIIENKDFINSSLRMTIH